MSNNPFQNFDFLKRFRHVKHLIANNSNIFQITQLPEQMLQQIVSASLQSNNLQKLTGIEKMRSVQFLDLSNNQALKSGQETLFGALCANDFIKLTAENSPINTALALKYFLKVTDSRPALDFGLFSLGIASQHIQTPCTQLLEIYLNEKNGETSFSPLDIQFYGLTFSKFFKINSIVSNQHQLCQNDISMQLNTSKLEFLVVSCTYRATIRVVAISVQEDKVVSLDSVAQYYQQQINKYNRGTREQLGIVNEDIKNMHSHFDTNLQISATFGGEWCSITPASIIKNAVWFYSVFTYDQLIAQVQERIENTFPNITDSLQ